MSGDWIDKVIPDIEAWAEQFRARPVVGRPFVVPAGAEEAALRENLAETAQKIAGKVRRGEVSHGLPPGYRFEFARVKEPHPLDATFAAQVRGTAPEPPLDGFALPPGFAEDLRELVAELFGIPAGMMEPAPTPTRRERWKSKIDMWRNLAARRAYKIIAGYWPDDGEDW